LLLKVPFLRFLLFHSSAKLEHLDASLLLVFIVNKIINLSFFITLAKLRDRSGSTTISKVISEVNGQPTRINSEICSSKSLPSARILAWITGTRPERPACKKFYIFSVHKYTRIKKLNTQVVLVLCI
jgi:hypothetical protein